MNAQQVNINYTALFNAINDRESTQHSKDNLAALSLIVRCERGIKSGMVSIKNDTFLDYISMQSSDIALRGKNEYCAVKVNVKILQALNAIGQKSIRFLDGYSESIIQNTLSNDNALTSKSALMSLCRDLEYSSTDLVQKLQKMNSAAETASTQKSSSKEFLRIMKLTDGIKNARNAFIVLNESGIKILEPLFDKVLKTV